MTHLIEQEFMLEVNVKVTPSLSQKLLEAQDVDKSGEIDFAEFKALVLK